MTRAKTAALLMVLLIGSTGLAGCGGGESDKSKAKADPDVAICGELVADRIGPISKTLDLAEDYVETGNAKNARDADPVAIADDFEALTEPGSSELSRLIVPITIDLNRIYDFTVGNVDSMTDLNVLLDEIDALMVHCRGVNDAEEDGPSASGSDSPKAGAFDDLEGMRTAYEELTGARCFDADPIGEGSDVTYLLCDASTDDVSSDVLIYQLDAPGPVEDLAKLEISMSSGTTDRVVAHADDWRWAVATASSERLSKVIGSFPDASDETVKSSD